MRFPHSIRAGRKAAVGFAVCAAILAPAGPSVAATERCREGSFELSDQRDLRELAAEIEAACPCASFTNHGTYVTCAKQVRRNAELAGDLRAKCRSTANRALRTSTCGTDKITCGRFKTGATDPVSCRIREASRCVDQPPYLQAACAQTHCSEVEEWTAASCLDPRAPGPFNTGVRVISYTKPSAVDPDQDRTLDTAIWYPTSDTGPLAPGYEGILDASVDGSAGPYPVLLFSHGSCGYSLQSTFLTALLATRGFIVVAPPHPGNTILDGASCGAFQSLVASALERPQDMIFVLNQILAADADPGSDFFGVVDESRIGMSGHSFGGLTTYLVQPNEPRITVAMPMAPATSSNSRLTVPSLTMRGAIDSVVNNANILAAYGRSSSPKILADIEYAGHYAFSNLCFPGSDCSPPATLTQDEAHAAVLRYAVPFLQVYLRGDASWSQLLEAPAGPGFVVTSE